MTGDGCAPGASPTATRGTRSSRRRRTTPFRSCGSGARCARRGGWRPVRLAIGPAHDEPLAGVQLLLRPMPVLGWHLAYVPRGPIGELDDPAVRDALVRPCGRSAATSGSPRSGPTPRSASAYRYGAALMQPPWQPAAKVQPPTTRVIDLTAGEDAAAGQRCKRKHRPVREQGRAGGVEVERFDGSAPPEVIGPALADFNRIYRLTAERAGFVAREPFYYERVWSIFAPSGRVRL